MQNFHKILENVEYYNTAESCSVKCDESQKKKIREYIALLNKESRKDKIKYLFRGTKIKILRSKMISNLNSNNSLFDGLFLIGEKAKNYLTKTEKIPHPIKNINSKKENAVNWIFDEYQKLKSKSIATDYFNESNRINFETALVNEICLIDYYLMGLHTWNSDLLVNFVSATSNSKVALSNDNDLIIHLWMSEKYSKHVIGKSTLNLWTDKLSNIELPVIKILFEEEMEYSFKGFILPHYILGVYHVSENKFIINPSLLDNKDSNWVQNGFKINNEKFANFIKTTKYERFLTLHDNTDFEEQNI